MRAFQRFAWRDLTIVALTFAGWLLFGQASAGEGWIGDLSGATLGVAAGICAWLVHEWGHLLAGTAVGGQFRAPERLTSVYLFGFDKQANGQLQFLFMALGGFAATALVAWGVFTALPPDWMATRVVRGLVLLQVGAIVLLEVPGFVLGLLDYKRLPSIDVLGD